ncbi:MAG: folylpolyglutamate synthase/dihydrofolate synthase family protein [Candidatus Altiarchaeota archaeon]
MDYGGALDYLYTLRKSGIKLRLSHTAHLLELMGNPHMRFKSVHVGGTNGKGSVCAMIYSSLMEAGHSVGMYTSPHLMEFTERIQADGSQIPPDVLARMLDETIPLINGMQDDKSVGEPSFFEVITAIAFKYFADNGVDLAVVEVGLGGRLDSTNVLTPLVSVITNVQMDHREVLGDSVLDIAREKAGIIKEGVPVVTSEEDPKTLSLFERTCQRSSKLHVVGKDVSYKIKKISHLKQVFDVDGIRLHENIAIRFMGVHQIKNAAAAVTALDVLNAGGVDVPEDAIRSGLVSAVWPGRFEVLDIRPKTVLDCAHNPDGARTLKESLRQHFGDRKFILSIGVSDYKDIDGILSQLLPVAKHVIVARSNHPQAASPNVLRDKIERMGAKCTAAASAKESIQTARSLSGEDDILVFSGSIFFVGDIRKLLLENDG